MLRYPAIAAAALSATAMGQVDYLTKPSAKEAIRKTERKAVEGGAIDSFKVGACQRRGAKRVRCYVKETTNFNDATLHADGWTGVWLRDGKTVIRYPRQKRG